MVPDWSAYANFAAVIAVQLLWFIFVSLGRVTVRRAFINLALGGAAGVPLGFFFDLVIGKFASIFHYTGIPITLCFMLVNGILSYGLAIATVLSAGYEALPVRGSGRRAIASLVAAAAFSLAVLLPVHRMPPIAGMFLLGAMVLLFSEALAMACCRLGYIAQVGEGRFRPALRLWIFSGATGLVYEAANSIFDLWTWENRFPTPLANLVMVVLLGYVVLLLPIFTFAALLAGSGMDQFARGKQELDQVEERE